MIKRILQFFFNNRSTKQTVAKNTFWLFFSNIFSRFIRAALVIYAARLLKTEEWGAFNYAMSLVSFFIIFADFGVNAVMTRESAKDPTQQEKYFSTSFFIKVIASIFIVLFLILLYPLLLPYLTSSTKDYSLIGTLIPIVAFIVIFDSLRDFGAALSRAWEKMEIESVIQVFTNTVIVIVGITALYFVPSAKSLALGYTIGTAIGMVAAFVPFRHYFKTLFSKFSWKLVKGILASSWPFGMMGVMGSIMLSTDSIIIGWLRSIEDVAYYSAGQRIAGLLYTIPSVISTAFFPTLAKLVDQKDRFGYIVEKAIKSLSIVALPLTVGGIILAKQIIALLYGDRYFPGATTLIIMNMSYLPVFVSTMLGNSLFALKKESKLFGYVAIAMIGNLILDLIFIPIWGIAGSAFGTLINQILSTLYLVWLLKKEVPFGLFRNLKKSALGSIIMGLLVYLLMVVGVPLILNIILSGLVYFGVLMLIKEDAVIDLIQSGKRNILNK